MAEWVRYIAFRHYSGVQDIFPQPDVNYLIRSGSGAGAGACKMVLEIWGRCVENAQGGVIDLR